MVLDKYWNMNERESERQKQKQLIEMVKNQQSGAATKARMTMELSISFRSYTFFAILHVYRCWVSRVSELFVHLKVDGEMREESDRSRIYEKQENEYEWEPSMQK